MWFGVWGSAINSKYKKTEKMRMFLEWNQDQYFFCRNGSKSVIENNNNRRERQSLPLSVVGTTFKKTRAHLVFVVISVDSVDVTLAPLRQSHNQHLPTTTCTSETLVGRGRPSDETGLLSLSVLLVGRRCDSLCAVACCLRVYFSACFFLGSAPRSLCYFNNN